MSGRSEIGEVVAIMASVTAPPRTRNANPPWQRARKALAGVGHRGAKVVSAARHRNWSPALTITGLGSIDIGAWETFGRGAGWAALGVSLLLFDFSRDKS